MKLISTLALCIAASSAMAAGNATYDGKDIYHTNATLADLSSETTRLNEYNYGNTLAIQALSGRADDTDIAQIGQNQRLDAHDVKFTQQETINDALSSKLNGMYTDTAGLRSEVRQARREAREAKAGASAALAVAGQQFDTHGGFQTSVSASTLGGYQAIAIGAGGALSDRIFVNAAFTTSSSVSGGVVAMTYSFGK